MDAYEKWNLSNWLGFFVLLFIACCLAAKKREMIVDAHRRNQVTVDMLYNLQRYYLQDPAATRLEISLGKHLDGWGRPITLHQESNGLLRLHSDGPDKEIGTVDDMVAEFWGGYVSRYGQHVREPANGPKGWKFNWKWGK